MQNECVYLKKSPMDIFRLRCSQVFLFLCVCLCVLTIYINLTYSVAPVSGLSMYPTLNSNEEYLTKNLQDRVVLNYIKTCKKGDIIVAKKVFNNDEENYIYVIKRLIATGGDTVEIKSDGSVYVNDIKLNEDYVNSTNKSVAYSNFVNLKTTFSGLFDGDKMTVPEGYIFYLGDNRGVSSDCSSYGPVKESNLIAKVDFILKANESPILCIFKQIFKIK